MTNCTDITIIITKDVTLGRNDDRAAITLHDVPVHTDRRLGGRFVYLPGIATCDGYRAISDDGAAYVNANEGAAIFRRICKGFAAGALIA